MLSLLGARVRARLYESAVSISDVAQSESGSSKFFDLRSFSERPLVLRPQLRERHAEHFLRDQNFEGAQ